MIGFTIKVTTVGMRGRPALSERYHIAIADQAHAVRTLSAGLSLTDEAVEIEGKLSDAEIAGLGLDPGQFRNAT